MQGGEERLGGGVVQRGAYSSHRLDDPQPSAGAGEGVGSVLGTAVGVKDHSSHVSAAGGYCHVDGGLGQCGGGVCVAESEAQNAAGVQVLDGCQVDGSLLGGDVFEVPAPLCGRGGRR